MGKKNTETAERGEKERGCIFLCVRLNVHDHVRLMKKARKRKTEKKTKKICKNEAQPAYSQFYLKASFICTSMCTSVFISITLPTKAAPLNISSALGKKSAQQGGTSPESAGTFCSSLFSRSLMELSSGAQAGMKQQPHAPQLHPFDCTLLHVHVYCLCLQCMKQT